MDYYNILKVNRNATVEDLKKSYRRLARTWHPDKNPTGGAEAEAKFKQITEAYESSACASRRFVVRAAHLNHPVFRELLRQAEEEYGFPSGARGPIELPCDEGLFEHVLRHLSSPSSAARFVTLEDLKSGAFSCCCAAGEVLPLLRDISSDKFVW